MRMCIIVLFVLLPAIAAGCGGPDIAGHWEVIGEAVSYDFLPDGAFIIESQSEDMLYLRGSWEVQGGELCLTFESGVGDCFAFTFEGDYLEFERGAAVTTLRRD